MSEAGGGDLFIVDNSVSGWTLVLSIVEHTIKVTLKAAALLDQIVNGPLIPASDLPTPTPANRKPRRV